MWNLIFFNPVLVVSLVSWGVAQTIKFLIKALKGDINFYNFITTGGMPSGHSAVVCALATGIGLSSGFSSPLFAVTAAIAVIIMHDAVVIRGAQGRQAQVLNKVIDKFQGEFQEHHFKVKLGHTPIEVAVGALLGIMITLALWDFLYV